MQSALEALSQSMQKIGEAVYGAGGASADGASEGGSTEQERGSQEGTVEGEFREV
jgi:hypothetical protein